MKRKLNNTKKWEEELGMGKKRDGEDLGGGKDGRRDEAKEG